MTKNEKEFKQGLHAEFLRSLHDEKVKTQSERATYITSKFAFITGLFGLGALKVGSVDFSTLLYFIPLVAIGYDLYIRAADLSIKKMGAFLRSNPQAETTEIEKAWEKFAAENRDRLAQLATTLFTFIIIIAAAVSIYTQRGSIKTTIFFIGFSIWLIASLIGNTLLWTSHHKQVKRLDEYTQQR